MSGVLTIEELNETVERALRIENAKPILFNTPMVQAILNGTKTVTRRVVKGIERDADFIEMEENPCVEAIDKNGEFYPKQLSGLYADFSQNALPMFPVIRAPYQPGDLLYVRETWALYSEWAPVEPDPELGMFDSYLYRATWDGRSPKWHPSIHMPKEAARIFLRVTKVWVERLQDITEEQARAEGAKPFMLSPDVDKPDCEKRWYEQGPALPHYIDIWKSTIKKADLDRYGWSANPWVFVTEFERIAKEEI